MSNQNKQTGSKGRRRISSAPKGKATEIRRLIAEGNFSNREIAILTGTTTQNVIYHRRRLLDLAAATTIRRVVALERKGRR